MMHSTATGAAGARDTQERPFLLYGPGSRVTVCSCVCSFGGWGALREK